MTGMNFKDIEIQALADYNAKMDPIRKEYPNLHHLLTAMVDVDADQDALALLARAKAAELEVFINRTKSVRIGFNTMLTKNGGAPGTVREWLNTYDINDIESMIVEGHMKVVDEHRVTSKTEKLSSWRIEVRYRAIPGGDNPPVNDLDLEEMDQYLKPMGTIDEAALYGLQVGESFVTCDGYVRVECYRAN